MSSSFPEPPGRGAAQPRDMHTVAGLRAVAGLHAIGLLLLGLHLYVYTLPRTPTPLPAATDPEAAWWGLWPVTYAPAWAVAAGALAVLLSMAWGWWRLLTPRPLPTWGRGVALLATGALLAAFFLFPIAHTRWGDAYILAHAIAWPDPSLRLTHSWQAPLDVWLHSQVWLALGPRLGWATAIPVYRLLSPLAGALYLAALLALARDRRFAPGWLTLALGASLGVIQLFFGYIENYAFAAAGILGFLWLGRRVVQGRSPLWHAAAVLALTQATHPSAVVLSPALLYLGWVTWRRESAGRGGTTAGVRVVLQIGAPMLLVAGATLALMEAGGHGLAVWVTTDRPGGGDARWFVPLWATATRWEAYTLLSWPHLRDLLNQLLLVAPVVLPSLLWLAAQPVLPGAPRPPLERGESATRHMLALAALGHLLLITVWNPDYGGQRDWDLFSLAWIPVTLWLLSVAQGKLTARAIWAGFAPLALLQTLHTAAWVYQNTLPWQWP